MTPLDRNLRVLVFVLALFSPACFLFDEDSDDPFKPGKNHFQYLGYDIDHFATLEIPWIEVDLQKGFVPFGSTFSVKPSLPDGLSIDAASGTISGVPAAPTAETKYEVRADNGKHESFASVFLEIHPAVPPSELAYSTNPASYGFADWIPENIPSYEGIANSFSVTPPMPEGLTLNETSGAVNGFPTVEQESIPYTVTASNPFGEATVELWIEIGPTKRARIFFVGYNEPVLGTYRPVGSTLAGESYAPMDFGSVSIAVDSLSRYVYVAEPLGEIKRFPIDPVSGELGAAEFAAEAPGVVALASTVDDDKLVALSSGTLAVWDRDPATGALCCKQTALASQLASSVALHPSGDFAYVTNGSQGTLSVYALEPSLQKLDGDVTAGSAPLKVVASSSGTEIYVADQDTPTVSHLQVDLDQTGSADDHLTLRGSYALGSQPSDLAISPDGDYLFASEVFLGRIMGFLVQPDGSLVPGEPTPAGSYTTRLLAGPKSHKLYVLDAALNEIWTFGIHHPTGTLSLSSRTRTRQSPATMGVGTGGERRGASRHALVASEESSTVTVYALEDLAQTIVPTPQGPVPTGSGPVHVAVHPWRSFAYASNRQDGTVSGFVLDQTSGELVPMDPPEVAAGQEPVGLAIDPSGRFAYGVDGAGRVFPFGVDEDTGTLSPVANPVLFETELLSAHVEPTGQYLYVLAPTLMYELRIDPLTGGLTHLGTSPLGGVAADFRLHPSGRFAYVASPVPGSVLGFDIDAHDGSLAPMDVSSFPTGAGTSSIDLYMRGTLVMTANPGSDDLSALVVEDDGGLTGHHSSPYLVDGTPVEVSLPELSDAVLVVVEELGQKELRSYRRDVEFPLTSSQLLGSGAHAMALDRFIR